MATSPKRQNAHADNDHTPQAGELIAQVLNHDEIPQGLKDRVTEFLLENVDTKTLTDPAVITTVLRETR